MQIGEEGDTRQYRRAKPTDYSPSVKAALDQKEKTSWDRCEVCGQEITGKTYSCDGKYLCFRCNNA